MELKKTITTIFIIPTLGVDREDLKENGFLNGYISDKRKDVQHKDAVYLLFKPENLDKFRSFLEEEISKNQGIIDDYDYEDGYVVIVYKLDPKWKKDYTLIKKGLYSKTSKKFQETFPRTITVKRGQKELPKKETTLQHRVFEKSEELRSYWEDKTDTKFTDDMELWDGFHIENETLNLDKIKTEELV
jgi:hypothetical protein